VSTRNCSGHRFNFWRVYIQKVCSHLSKGLRSAHSILSRETASVRLKRGSFLRCGSMRQRSRNSCSINVSSFVQQSDIHVGNVIPLVARPHNVNCHPAQPRGI